MHKKTSLVSSTRNLRGPFVTNSFGDNWFISVGAGVNTWFRTTTSPTEEYNGFAKATPVFQLSVGKMIHPYWGLRVQGNFGKIKDYTSLLGMYTESVDSSNPAKFNMQFNYWDVEGALLFHFSNAVSGYKAARFYNAILFTGTSYMRSYGKDMNNDKHATNQLAFNFGLLNTLRLARGLDFYTELKANVVRQDFTAAAVTGLYSGAENWGMLPSITFGLTYKFKGRDFFTLKTASDRAVADATRARDGRISTLQNELEAAENLAAKYKKLAETAPKTTIETETVVKQVPLAVFFKKGEAELTEFEMLNVRYVADVIKKNPDKKYSLIGMADKETGSHEFNQTLSEKRAEIVRKALVGYGVKSSQLEVKSLGDRSNPFELNEMNRTVIIE